MGATVRLVVYAPDRASAADACRAAFKRIETLEAVMSDYRDDSELMQLLAHSGEGPQSVSDDMMRVLQAAQQISERTDGAFDVTVAPLSHLWRKPIRRLGELPDAKAIEAARKRVGWQRLRLDPKAGTVELTQPKMQLDLGGIGKGFTGDEVLAVLADHGLTRALYQAEGDIVVGDAPPGRKGWRIRRPTPGNEDDFDEEALQLTLEHQAISTSGDTQKYIEVDGVRYAHIVDPRTGKAVTERYFATVVARTGAIADALATTATILGPKETQAILERWYPEARLFIKQLP